MNNSDKISSLKPLEVNEVTYLNFPRFKKYCPFDNSCCLEWMEDTNKTILDLPNVTTSDKRFLHKNVFIIIDDGDYVINNINEKKIIQKDLKTIFITKSSPNDSCLDCFADLFNIRDKIFGQNKNYFHDSLASSCLSKTMRNHCITEQRIEQILILMSYLNEPSIEFKALKVDNNYSSITIDTSLDNDNFFAQLIETNENAIGMEKDNGSLPSLTLYQLMDRLNFTLNL